MVRKLCGNDKHVWRALRGGRYERCEVCKTFFPCKSECTHNDCKLARSGRAHLDGYNLPGWPLTEKDPTVPEPEEKEPNEE